MKKYNKIILAGGTGQIGTALCHYFKNITETIIILSRSPASTRGNIHIVTWDGTTVGPWKQELEGADMLINLAGKNVNCRYNAANRELIINSRVNSVKALAQAVATCKIPPLLWIQCASATMYRDARDRAMDEEMGETGEGFSVEVCKKWENAFWEQTSRFTSMRKVVLRISLVLSDGYGLLPRLKNLVHFGLGGRQGDGKQMVSWVHEKDAAGIIDWIASHPLIEGTLNCTAPYPISNHEMMEIVRKELGMPFGLPAPRFLLQAGAWLIGTETELVLKSRWVKPSRVMKSGYTFAYPHMENAIHAILKK